MRQRLGLAAALLRSPRLLVLDEPTNGLDPQGIREIRDLLLRLNQEGTTIFLSTHLLAEIEQMCGRVGVLDRGRLVLQERLDVLRRPTGRLEVHTPDVAQARSLLDGQVVSFDARRLFIRHADAAALNSLLVAGGCALRCSRPRSAPSRRSCSRRPRPARTGWRGRDRGRAAQDAPEPADLGDVAVIDLLPSLVAVLLALTDLGPRPGTGPAFLSAVLANGTLFPLAAIAIILPLFLPAAVAITAGETIAGEAQQGTLRYVLIRPVGRTRLLVAKLVSVMAFVLLTLLVVAATAYVLGVLLLGHRAGVATTTFSGTQLTTSQLVERTGLALAYSLLSMLGVAAVALFLSTVVRSPLAAAMGTLALLIGSSLLLTLDAAHWLRPYLVTRYWLSFVDLFRDPILWHDVVLGVLLQVGYVVVFLGAAWANFVTKDITD